MNIEQSTSAIALAMTLGACGAPEPAPYIASEEIDRSCVIAASDKLRMVRRLEASDGRAMPSPSGPNGSYQYRMVELDAVSAGQKVTYVFACVLDPRSGMVTAGLAGHK